MQTREFMAISQPNVALAELAASPFGWTAAPADRAEVASLGPYGRAIELTHARAPVSIVVVEDAAQKRAPRRGETTGGSFVYLSSGFSDSSRLSTLLRHPLIQELVEALGTVSLGNRLQPALAV